MPSVAIRRLLTAIGQPPHQWNVVGVEITVDCRGPSLVRVARTNGTSEVWQDMEILDKNGHRFAPGSELKRMVDAVAGRPVTFGQRITLTLRVGSTPKVTVESVPTTDDITAWVTAIETQTAVVPVVELMTTGKTRCTVCYNPNCDEPGGKH